jgi:hypothetical protein
MFHAYRRVYIPYFPLSWMNYHPVTGMMIGIPKIISHGFMITAGEVL